MTTDKIKRMMDACYLAKRIRDMLPELPEGVAPSYISYIDTVHKLESGEKKVKISDISDTLNLPRPGVTRTVKEMEAKGILRRSRPVRMDVLLTFPLQKREKSCLRNTIKISSAN